MAKDENKKIKNENKNMLKNLKIELKKVVWPTPKQLANNTIAVITIVLITAVIVFGLDFVFEKANEYGIEKLKSSVESKEEINNENLSNTEDDNTDDENKEAEEDINQSDSSEKNDATNENVENSNSEEQQKEN